MHSLNNNLFFLRDGNRMFPANLRSFSLMAEIPKNLSHIVFILKTCVFVFVSSFLFQSYLTLAPLTE